MLPSWQKGRRYTKGYLYLGVSSTSWCLTMAFLTLLLYSQYKVNGHKIMFYCHLQFFFFYIGHFNNGSTVYKMLLYCEKKEHFSVCNADFVVPIYHPQYWWACILCVKKNCSHYQMLLLYREKNAYNYLQHCYLCFATLDPFQSLIGKKRCKRFRIFGLHCTI